MRWSTKKYVVGTAPSNPEDIVRVLVGDEQREFTLGRKLLSNSCAFFRTNIASMPPPSPASQSGDDEEDSVLWLPAESPDMFEIFVLWLYQRRRFHQLLDDFLHRASTDERRSTRTNMVLLHLFAAVIDLPALQDMAMDAIQDMYLRFNWDMSPRFVAFLYGDCDADHAVRLRKWGVAMLAWTLHGADDKSAALAGPMDRLFAAYPALGADYHMHLEKMAQSRADVRLKNPQLRLPVNRLRNGERFFGFRQCTFHSHRAAVGEGACPHSLALSPALVPPAAPAWKRDSDEAVSDDSDVEDPIISPVGNLNEMSYLDLS